MAERMRYIDRLIGMWLLERELVRTSGRHRSLPRSVWSVAKVYSASLTLGLRLRLGLTR